MQTYTPFTQKIHVLPKNKKYFLITISFKNVELRGDTASIGPEYSLMLKVRDDTGWKLTFQSTEWWLNDE